MLQIISNIFFCIIMSLIIWAIIYQIIQFVKIYLYKVGVHQKRKILSVIAIWLYRIEDTGNSLIYEQKKTEEYRKLIKKEYFKLLKNGFLKNSTDNDFKTSIVFAYRNAAYILYMASIVINDYDKLDNWYIRNCGNRVMSRFEYSKEKKSVFDKFCIEKEKIVAYLK